MQSQFDRKIDKSILKVVRAIQQQVKFVLGRIFELIKIKSWAASSSRACMYAERAEHPLICATYLILNFHNSQFNS